jgi:hypothetical protein
MISVREAAGAERPSVFLFSAVIACLAVARPAFARILGGSAARVAWIVAAGALLASVANRRALAMAPSRNRKNRGVSRLLDHSPISPRGGEGNTVRTTTPQVRA